jgi:ectoine hydroxylase-related dioxygenase (phytanoyl-CoA dioxygenase family)
VLSLADHAFFEEHGYVLVRNAVPAEHVARMEAATWDFLQMDPADRATWYHPKHGGMVQCYQLQAQWDNRSHPRVHQAFADLWGTERLWTSFDMSHMKPPARPEDEAAGFCHWDLGEQILRQPLHLRVQGELLLRDMTPDAGGFQCVPGFHREVPAWIRGRAEGDAGMPAADSPAMEGFELKHVEGKAGDLLIWHSFLPHGSCRNNSDEPRMMQLISMSPCDAHTTFNSNYVGDKVLGLEAERNRRIALWREQLHVASFDSAWDPAAPYRTTGFGGERDLVPGPPARLSPLGERLLGLAPWE